MTKKDIASLLHKKLGLNLKESARIVDKFFEIIVETFVAELALKGSGRIDLQRK